VLEKEQENTPNPLHEHYVYDSHQKTPEPSDHSAEIQQLRLWMKELQPHQY
jgi:hypothetical protein